MFKHRISMVPYCGIVILLPKKRNYRKIHTDTHRHKTMSTTRNKENETFIAVYIQYCV